MHEFNKYGSVEAYVMDELLQSHKRIIQLEQQLEEVVKKLRSTECQLTNQNNYIIELEDKLGIEGDV